VTAAATTGLHDTEPSLPYLQLHSVTKTFGRFIALADISLTITGGEFVCFLGPSGCGKTTLLRIIAGLDAPDSGQIIQNGVDISRLPATKRDFGIVFQSYALFPNLTAAQNVAFGLENRKVPRLEIHQRVQQLLALVGLEQMGQRYPAHLSGVSSNVLP
jgi:iron(III) transport system ATP-binding protein